MKTLIKKELHYYLNNPVGYIVIILFGIFANFLFVKDIFLVNSASLRPFFTVMPWLFMVFIPAIAMRSISEEKRTNTIELLLSLPISEAQIVISKYVSLLILTLAALLVTFGIPISLSYITEIYFPEIIVGYFGVLLMGSAFIGISMFFSTLSKNQVVSFLGSALVIFILIVVSTDFAANVLPKAAQDYLVYLSPTYHLETFIKGVIDVRSVFYFLSITVAFLFLTIIDLEKRN